MPPRNLTFNVDFNTSQAKQQMVKFANFSQGVAQQLAASLGIMSPLSAMGQVVSRSFGLGAATEGGMGFMQSAVNAYSGGAANRLRSGVTGRQGALDELDVLSRAMGEMGQNVPDKFALGFRDWRAKQISGGEAEVLRVRDVINQLDLNRNLAPTNKPSALEVIPEGVNREWWMRDQERNRDRFKVVLEQHQGRFHGGPSNR